MLIRRLAKVVCLLSLACFTSVETPSLKVLDSVVVASRPRFNHPLPVCLMAFKPDVRLQFSPANVTTRLDNDDFFAQIAIRGISKHRIDRPIQIVASSSSIDFDVVSARTFASTRIPRGKSRWWWEAIFLVLGVIVGVMELGEGGESFELVLIVGIFRAGQAKYSRLRVVAPRKARKARHIMRRTVCRVRRVGSRALRYALAFLRSADPMLLIGLAKLPFDVPLAHLLYAVALNGSLLSILASRSVYVRLALCALFPLPTPHIYCRPRAKKRYKRGKAKAP